MNTPVDSVRHGLVARLRNLLLALDRQDRLETAQEFAGWMTEHSEPQDLADYAREILLRAFRVAGDPINFEILSRLDRIDPVGIPDLMRTTHLSRVAVSERVNDMVQTGLAVREMVNDHVRGTDLGEGLTAFVRDAAKGAGDDLTNALGIVEARRDHPGRPS